MSYLSESYDAALKENEALRQERDDAVEILQRLLECQRTCPTILRFAVSAKEILKDAGRWRK